MGPIWGRQDPGEHHVGPMNFAVWDDTGYADLAHRRFGKWLCICSAPCHSLQQCWFVAFEIRKTYLFLFLTRADVFVISIFMRLMKREPSLNDTIMTGGLNLFQNNYHADSTKQNALKENCSFLGQWWFMLHSYKWQCPPQSLYFLSAQWSCSAPARKQMHFYQYLPPHGWRTAISLWPN